MEREDLMAPKGLKIGDTYDEKDFSRTFRLKIVGFDGQGNYLSECIGEVKDEPVIADDAINEEQPFASTDDDVVEQPIVEEPKEVKEVKKATPKKKTPAKKKTTTKKK